MPRFRTELTGRTGLSFFWKETLAKKRGGEGRGGEGGREGEKEGRKEGRQRKKGFWWGRFVWHGFDLSCLEWRWHLGPHLCELGAEGQTHVGPQPRMRLALQLERVPRDANSGEPPKRLRVSLWGLGGWGGSGKATRRETPHELGGPKRGGSGSQEKGAIMVLSPPSIFKERRA